MIYYLFFYPIERQHVNYFDSRTMNSYMKDTSPKLIGRRWILYTWGRFRPITDQFGNEYDVTTRQVFQNKRKSTVKPIHDPPLLVTGFRFRSSEKA